MLVPPDPDPKPDLLGADDAGEVYDLAYRLAAWGLRHGKCDTYGAADWVLGHAHDEKLPRRSSGRLEPTERPIRNGAERAAEQFVPGLRRGFDPGPLHGLAARVSGSGIRDERYLLGALALGHRYATLRPVITGRLLAEVTSVSKVAACAVLKRWSGTLADGFFTEVSFDGKQGHGRLWTIDPGWEPLPRFTHEPGCNRSRTRCRCRKIVDLSFSGHREKIDQLECDTSAADRTQVIFDRWVAGLKPGTGVTISDACKVTGATRYKAEQLLKGAEGESLRTGTYPGGRVRKRGPDGMYRVKRQGRTWFVAKEPERERKAKAEARFEANRARHKAELETVSACQFVDCDMEAPVGQWHCPTHETLMVEARGNNPPTP